MAMLHKRNTLKSSATMDLWTYIPHFDRLRNFLDPSDDYGTVTRECVGKNYTTTQRKISKPSMTPRGKKVNLWHFKEPAKGKPQSG